MEIQESSNSKNVVLAHNHLGHSSSYSWVRDFVYGGLDGSVTTFAVVAGSQGADLSNVVVIILGFANLFADGFSMAVGKYSSDRAELERIQKVRRLEQAASKNNPQQLRSDIQSIMEEHGLRGECVDCATSAILTNHKGVTDLLMKHKFNIVDESIYPVKSSLTTFFAFNVVGFIPMIAYVFSQNVIDKFYLAAILTLAAFFTVGAIKSKFTDKSWLMSGLGTLMMGGAAASVAYAVGYLLRGLAG